MYLTSEPYRLGTADCVQLRRNIWLPQSPTLYLTWNFHLDSPPVQYIPTTLPLDAASCIFPRGGGPPADSFALHRRQKPASPIFQFHAHIRKGKRCFVLTAFIADVCQERKNCFIDPRHRGCDDCDLLAVWKRSTWTGSDLILAIPIELSVPGSKNRSCNQMLSPRLLANGNSASLTTPN